MNLITFSATSGINKPEVAQKIKGLMALVVVLGHIAPFMSAIYYVISGAIAVGIFFYYSAFGSEISYCTKKNYLNDFFRKKFVKLYIPYFIANAVFLISEMYQAKQSFNLNVDFILKFFGFYLANPVLWYIQHLIVFLVIFFFLKKYISIRYHLLIYFACYLCYIFLAILYDIPVWWYISTSSLLIGIFFSSDRAIPSCVVKFVLYMWMIFVILGEIYAICGIQMLNGVLPLLKGHPNYYAGGLILLIVPLFCLVLRFFCDEKYFQGKGPILPLLGACSYEIYLYHFPVKLWVDYLFPSLELLWSIPLIVLITAIVSYVMQQLHLKIYKYFRFFIC